MSQLIETYDSAPNYTMSGVEIAAGVAKLLRNEPSALKTKLSNFGTPGDYTFDSAKIDLASGSAKLKLPTGAQSFSQPFSSATGFTFDSALAEFSSGVIRQLDKTAANSILAAKYPSTIDANWAKTGASTTGTAQGSPVIVSGRLQCFGANGVYYSGSAIGALAAGAVKFMYRPNYTTGPSTNINVVALLPTSGSNDRLTLTHSPSGNTLRIFLENNVGTSIYSAVAIGPAFNPVTGTEYEFELNWDSVAGTVRIFINGVLHGTLSPGAWTRGASATRLYVGANPSVYTTANAEFDNVILFSTVQHTTGYTPGYTPVDTIYAETPAILPAFTHPLVGVIHSLSSLSTTEANSPRYFIKVGAGSFLYWNGSAWATSNQSYAQAASTAATSANLGTLPSVDGSTVITVGVVFPSQNVQGSVDLLTLNYSGDTTYAVDNPTITMTAQAVSEAVGISSLDALSAVVVATGSDSVRFRLSTDGGTVYQYWNGSAWATSTGFAETNTLAEILANQGTLVKTSGLLKLQAFLHSAAGTSTPSLDDLQLDYKIFQYRTAGGTIEANATMTAQEMEAFEAVTTIPSGDTLRFGLRVNGTLKYWNGSAWVASNGTNAQLNLASEWIEEVLSELLSVNSSVKLFARLTSGDGLTTPELDQTTVTFNAGAIEGPSAETCLVSFFIQKLDATPFAGVKVEFYPKPDGLQYLEASEHLLPPSPMVVITDINGYADLSLIRSSEVQGGPMQYRVQLRYPDGRLVKYRNAATRELILITVPDAVTADLTSLLTGLSA